MPNPVVRAASARVSSAATDKADRPGAIRHAEAPASVAAERNEGGSRRNGNFRIRKGMRRRGTAALDLSTLYRCL